MKGKQKSMSSLFWFALFVTSVILFDEVQTQSRECSRNGHVNGCSIPADLPFFYKRTFRRQCDKHDICYSCGDRNGISRRSCDRAFRRDMRRRCRSVRPRWRRPFCRAWANVYFAAVRIGGRRYFLEPSPRWCRRSWVGVCLNV